MAKFPIYTTERSLPGVGPAAYGRLDADTGAGAVARAVGQAGGALADVGMTIFRAQGEAELTEKMAEAAQRVSEMHLRFEQNLDETTYQQDFDQTFGEIENMEFKNGWARRQWNLRLPMMRQRQQELAKEAYHKRIRWKWDQAYTNEKAKAIETGNLRNFNVLLQSGHQYGFFTQDFVESERRDAKRLMQVRALEVQATTNPDAILSFQNYEKMHEENGRITPEDYQHLISFARAQKARTETDQEEAGRKVIAAIWSGQLTDPEEITRMLDAGTINLATAKFARTELIEGHPEVSDWLVLSRVRDAVLKMRASGANDIARQEALTTFYENAKRLSKADATAMHNRIYEDFEALLTDAQTTSEKIIDEIVRDKAELTGLFTDDRNQILGAAKGKMLLDRALQDAARSGKPLQGRDLILTSIDIATSIRAEVDAAEKMKTQFARPQPEEFVERKQLTLDVALEYLRRANGDREKAKRMAQADGYTE